MNTTRLQALVKPLLHAVLKRVHPDFFARQLAAKSINHRSVQRLQGLLAPVLTSATAAESADRRYELTHEPLEFVTRGSVMPQQKVTFSFNQQRTRSIAELQVQRTRDLLGLCKALDIAAAPEAQKEIEELLQQAGPQPAHGLSADAVALLRAARAREARRNYAQKEAAFDFRASLLTGLRKSTWSPAMNEAKTGQPKLDRRKLFFASEVKPGLYMDVVQRLESQLHKLDYSEWCMLPIMVVESWKSAFNGGCTRYPGCWRI
ncbi:hypothetical protein COEREDRAFT_86089 [Coemansia reversa NRRL 1564]|uniref:DUF4460 domain-containing protein n=1 Tax=Coemansia reversa (strain ATCC 12441 / NRRL 1564) TaxID=763665 RepID=A0A2G5BEM3_COERN|nr:hypothetical protein COEREDRAFT_86089 [Coemansia reversa NRRL 1564]|eukprot:PIA17464.1 hypothetical protein COEREDRAFT_86089 [Coemansia reversa NRRL 1564]